MKKEIETDARQINTFLYTLIHELKTPVREIELCSTFIEEDNKTQLPPQSIEDIHRIQRTCSNIMEMIDKLLDYSKAEAKNMEMTSIHTESLIRQCFDELMRTEKERPVQLIVDQLPELSGDLMLVRILITNILSNSIKFTRNCEHPVIKVSSKTESNQLTLTFSDNGVGFDMAYADKIFTPFERLNSSENYEGCGIGLATVKRIVNRMNGDVTVINEYHCGCTVNVMLPFTQIRSPVKIREHSAIRIGIIGDLTGIAAKEEQGKQAAYRLAADEINAAGGINGRRIELVVRDDQSINALTRKAAVDLIQNEHVDVLMGSTLSPSREIMQTYAQKTKTLYLNTQQTEGGVVSHYVFCLSATPEHQIESMLRWLFPRYGSNCFILAADYNYGILSAEWAKYFVRKLGGEVVGVEYLDNKIEDFTAFLEELRTPEAESFVRQYRKIYSKDTIPYMNMDTETAYTAVYLYKKAVEQAMCTDTEAVISAFESGRISFNGPGGCVRVRGEDHHTVRTLSCFRFNRQHQAEELFRTEPLDSKYIESMIKIRTGLSGGIRALGKNTECCQYNMLLDKLR